jgi:hypothetical protein
MANRPEEFPVFTPVGQDVVAQALASDVLNPKIALTLFTNTIMAYSAAKGKKKIPTSDFINDLYYSFRYRDLSKEAIMMMAEIFVQ